MAHSSFLPEDYLIQRAERRSSIFSIALFTVMMFAVIGAFFVTNRQWALVKIEQRTVNAEYSEAARKIDQLNQLEAQRRELLAKAEITFALVERVPRSILLAELINRMPSSISMENFELRSVALREPRRSAADKSRIKNLSDKKDDKQDDPPKVQVPTYVANVAITGVAPTDVHVSEYIAALNACPLLQEVNLKYSQETKVRDLVMRQFRIEMSLRPEADVKTFEPLKRSRTPRDPMSTDIDISPVAGVDGSTFTGDAP